MDEELIQFDVEEVDIEVEEGTGWNGGDGTRHSDMPDKYEPNQHIIESITGLREEIDNIEALKTVESDGYGTANYYKWGDGAHNEFGHFVSLVPETDKIVVCTGQDIFGVTVERAGFIGGQDEAMARDNTYGLVQTFDRVDVRCESDVSVGDSVLSNSYGVAMKTDSEYGYKVIAVNNIQGVAYATIALGVQACTTDALGKMIESLDTRLTSGIESLDTRLTSGIESLDTRLTTAESNIVAARPKLATIDIDHACITGGAKTDIGQSTFYGFYIGQNGLEVGGYYDKSISGYHNLTYTAATGELAVEKIAVDEQLETKDLTGSKGRIGTTCIGDWYRNNERVAYSSLVDEGTSSPVSVSIYDPTTPVGVGMCPFLLLDDGSLYTAAIKVEHDIYANNITASDSLTTTSVMADVVYATLNNTSTILNGHSLCIVTYNGSSQSEDVVLKCAEVSHTTYGINNLLDPVTKKATWLNIIGAGNNYSNSGSDSRIKHSIEMLPESYEALFDSLTARRYKYNDGTSDRYHTGYVAQEVVSAIEKAGLTTKDFAAVVLENPDTDQECWYLRRDEFVSLNTWQIQKLKARVAELEKIVAKLQEA